MLGSEGAFGVITDGDRAGRARSPTTTVYDGWRFATRSPTARPPCATLAQAGAAPTVLRLSDENETAINLAKPDEVGARAPAVAAC